MRSTDAVGGIYAGVDSGALIVGMQVGGTGIFIPTLVATLGEMRTKFFHSKGGKIYELYDTFGCISTDVEGAALRILYVALDRIVMAFIYVITAAIPLCFWRAVLLYRHPKHHHFIPCYSVRLLWTRVHGLHTFFYEFYRIKKSRCLVRGLLVESQDSSCLFLVISWITDSILNHGLGDGTFLSVYSSYSCMNRCLHKS